MGRVQGLSFETHTLEYVPMFRTVTPIDWIAKQRMTDRGHVDPHLMRPPGLEPAFDQRRAT